MTTMMEAMRKHAATIVSVICIAGYASGGIEAALSNSLDAHVKTEQRMSNRPAAIFPLSTHDPPPSSGMTLVSIVDNDPYFPGGGVPAIAYVPNAGRRPRTMALTGRYGSEVAIVYAPHLPRIDYHGTDVHPESDAASKRESARNGYLETATFMVSVLNDTTDYLAKKIRLFKNPGSAKTTSGLGYPPGKDNAGAGGSSRDQAVVDNGVPGAFAIFAPEDRPVFSEMKCSQDGVAAVYVSIAK